MSKSKDTNETEKATDPVDPAPVPAGVRDAKEDILDILHKIDSHATNMPRDHVKHLIHGIKTGGVSISGTYSNHD